MSRRKLTLGILERETFRIQRLFPKVHPETAKAPGSAAPLGSAFEPRSLGANLVP
jgi:hypothetical protein